MHATVTQTLLVDGHRLAYDVRGEGESAVVLVPGLLTSRRMQWALADALADRGHRVYTFDPLGFGDSDHPEDYWHYSVGQFADQLAAFMDHVGLETAVVYGTSLGTAIALDFASRYPDRLDGVVCEGPVLDHAMPGALPFAAFFLGYGVFAGPFGRVVARLTAALQIRAPHAPAIDACIDIFRARPAAIAAAMRGIAYSGFKLPRDRRQRIAVPALVIGYRLFDPIHPDADARLLAAEIGGAEYLRARTWLELRRRPNRLAPAIAEFIDSCHSCQPIDAAASA